MRAMVLRQVRQAFKLCGDLLVDVKLIPDKSGTYDMASMQPDIESSSVLDVKAIFYQETKLRGAVVEIQIMAENVPDISIYSSVELNGKLWKVVEPVINDSYLIRMGLN